MFLLAQHSTSADHYNIAIPCLSFDMYTSLGSKKPYFTTTAGTTTASDCDHAYPCQFYFDILSP
jgi:hypothetical protein